jgi:hypothetical protein
MWRNQKRNRGQAKSEQEATRQSEIDSWNTIERIGTQPFRTAGEAALPQSLEGELQPAVFEGIHVSYKG